MMELTDQQLTIRRPGRTIAIEVVTTERRITALIGIGHSATVARAVAAGDLAIRVRAVDLARSVGLLALVDTSEARAAGLLK